MNLDSVCSAQGLPEEEASILRDLITVWNNKLTRNKLRLQYYDGKNRLKDLGISIPPPLQNVETVIGWPAKAVDVLAVRSQFDGFTLDSGDESALSDVLTNNRFRITYDQAVTSELIYSCAFLTVSRGGPGEPGAIISAYPATTASALWDDRKKCIKAGMCIADMDRDLNAPDLDSESNTPTWINLYTDTDVWEIVKDADAEIWTAYRHPHKMGRPMMEPLVYRPSLDRPFGKSRINRAVMSLTDSAVRCALRTETAAEFVTTPQKYILGADDSIFADKSRWEAYIGNWLAISKDEDGDVPQLGQLTQGTLQPHIDYMRSLAQRFSGETCVPVSELGVSADSNPSSAEAMYAAKESLVIEAEALNISNSEALKAVGLMALACSRNVSIDELTDDEKSIKPKFKNPARPSIVSQSDAVVKMVAAIPWLADSQVILEELGFSEDEIVRLMADKRAAEVQGLLQQIQAKIAADAEAEAESETQTQTTAQTQARMNVNQQAQG